MSFVVLTDLALHRLPRPLTEPPEKPGQTLFEAPSTDTSSFLTGAQISASLDPAVATTPVPTPIPNDRPAKARKKPNRMTAAEVEALVKEASMDSRPPSRTGKEMPPPPPKVTSPTTEIEQPSIPNDLSDHEEEEAELEADAKPPETTNAEAIENPEP